MAFDKEKKIRFKKKNKTHKKVKNGAIDLEKNGSFNFFLYFIYNFPALAMPNNAVILIYVVKKRGSIQGMD